MARGRRRSGIHINPANRGKFTASAKRSGESVQQHAKSVMSNPSASPKERKRANFAIQARKWARNRRKGRSSSRRSR